MHKTLFFRKKPASSAAEKTNKPATKP